MQLWHLSAGERSEGPRLCGMMWYVAAWCKCRCKCKYRAYNSQQRAYNSQQRRRLWEPHLDTQGAKHTWTAMLHVNSWHSAENARVERGNGRTEAKEFGSWSRSEFTSPEGSEQHHDHHATGLWAHVESERSSYALPEDGRPWHRAATLFLWEISWNLGRPNRFRSVSLP